MKTKIFTDGFEGAAKRSLELAKRLDRGERIEPERTITFESPRDMAKALSSARVQLIQVARTGEYSISRLAEKLGRDAKSVRRDVVQLRDLGLVRTATRSNPGHGRVTIVKPVAKKLELNAVI
jgi:predicted transcriptional regulator